MLVYNSKILHLQKLLENRLEDLFERLNLTLNKNERIYYGCCPVHGGNNPTAFNFYHQEFADGIKHWVCYTHHCEQIFKKTIIGFIRGVLSNIHYGWSGPTDRKFDFNETIKWCLNFLKIKKEKLQVIKPNIKKENYSSQKIIERAKIIQKLKIPSDYFIKRGFSSKVLIKYDIGEPITYKKTEMMGRVVVPIYDETGQYFIGCTGRTINPKCEICECYHINDCPPLDKRRLYSKWKHSKNFNKKYNLYNYWYTKNKISKKKACILVEGPSDIWKLEEGGISIGMAIYGTELYEPQRITLEKLGIKYVLPWLDNDEAGKEGILKIQKLLKRSFQIILSPLEKKYKDFGDMPTQYIKEKYLPIIQELK